MTEPDGETTGRYQYNDHDFRVVGEFGQDEIVECHDCLVREVIEAEDDPKDRLTTFTTECRIEWLRKPDGGFHGIALRNVSGFAGRELISVDEDGEVADRVRVYDEDVSTLTSLLEQDWEDDFG